MGTICGLAQTIDDNLRLHGLLLLHVNHFHKMIPSFYRVRGCLSEHYLIENHNMVEAYILIETT